MRDSTRLLSYCAIFILVHAPLQADDGVYLFIPPDLGIVKFGDPVYLPVTIVNNSNRVAIVPCLHDGSPKMTIEARVNAPNSVLFEAMSAGYPTTIELPARHSIRCVLAVILWHPSTASFLTDNPELSIEVYSTKDANQSNWSLSGDLSDSSRVEISGSAVANVNDYVLLGEQMVDVMRDPSSNTVPNSLQMPRRLQQTYGILDFLYHGVTAWPKWQEDVLDQITGVSRLSETREYLAIRDQVVEGTALFRAMRCAEIREFIEHGEESLELRVEKGLKDFRDVLSEARPAEYEFHVLSLRHVRVSYPESDEQAKYRDAIREAFPEVLAGMTDEGFLPAIPLPH